MVEQQFCKLLVGGSIPLPGSMLNINKYYYVTGQHDKDGVQRMQESELFFPKK